MDFQLLCESMIFFQNIIIVILFMNDKLILQILSCDIEHYQNEK